MQSVTRHRPSEARRRSLVVFGAGGDIGSQLVPSLGRLSGVGTVVLVDRDVYEHKNLLSQAITPRDVGRPKAAVQARRLRAINPTLTVGAICEPLESLPLGRFRASVLLSCLDSRISRQWVNEIAFRLNTPWVDAGVDPAGLLARVTVYLPGRDAPCLECLWDERDYELLEHVHPCDGKAVVAPTNAPACLGALAAALQAIECQKLLDAAPGAAQFGMEQILDARFGKHYVTRLHHNPDCRFDHEAWSVRDTLSPSLTLTGLVDGTATEDQPPRSLRVAGRRFAARSICPRCNTAGPLRAFGATGVTCRRCGGEIPLPGSAVTDHLDVDALRPALRGRSLGSLGLRGGDLIALSTRSREHYFEVGESAPTLRRHRPGSKRS